MASGADRTSMVSLLTIVSKNSHTQPQRRAKDGPLSAMLTIVDKYPHSNRLRTKVSCFSAGSIHANTSGFNTGLEPASYNQFQPIPRQAMTSVTSARLGKSICHEYRYPPITETSMPSASDEELFQATSYSENTMTSADDALSPTTSGTVYIDPEVSLSLEAAGQYLQELNILEDGVKAVYVVVENHLFRIQNEQTTLWKKNPDLRRRGLRGGRARKQNATGKAFISITLEPPAEYKRRKEVETQDYQDRTRSSGLQNLADVFDNCYNLIHEQQRLAGLVLKHGNTLTSESAGLTELEDARTRYETAIGGIDREKMDEIQEMLDTFNAEFRCD